MADPNLPQKDLEKTWGWWLFWVLFFGAILSAKPIYNAIDDSGWITHHHDTATFIHGNWMTGEYRNCSLRVSANPTDRPSTQQPTGEPDLVCQPLDPGPTETAHILPVAYHGRIDRFDYPSFTWRCQRNDSSLTCWALD
jgi:hypothetical protein